MAIVPADHMVVLDVDGPEGQNTFKRLNLPATATAQTGRGSHHYFRVDPRLLMPKDKLAGIDVKTGNGYVVVPPSIHHSGKRYRFSQTNALETLRPDALAADRRVVRVDFSNVLRKIPEGQRDTTLTSFAGYLRYCGLSTNQIEPVLDAYNRVVCDPILDGAAISKIARSIGKYPSSYDDAFGTMNEVKEEEIRWLLHPYLARGAVTVLDGNPGQGKSTFVDALIGAITSDGSVPFGEKLAHGSVLMFSAEDDPARVTKRRLKANGANLSKVRFQKKPFTLDEHGIAMVRAELEKTRPVLVLIDPLVAYLDSQRDLNDAGSMTRFMIELDVLARDFDVAFLVIRHFRKAEADHASHRGLGSIAIAARVRSMLVLGRDPGEPNVRAIAHSKCSWAKEGPTIRFKIEDSAGTALVRWCEASHDLTADDLLARPPAKPGRQDTERDDAKKFLLGFLERRPRLKADVDRAAEARSITSMTLRRAAEDLAIIKFKDGQRSAWKLPSRSKVVQSDDKHRGSRRAA